MGKDENENPERRRVGEPRDFAAEGFEPKAHWDLGVETGILDFDRGAKLSGARFTVLSGAGATLDRALQNFFLNTHISRGFTEFIPPVIVNREIMYGTGQLPKFEDDAYHTGEDQFLIPTAEVALTNLHAGEVLDASQLPLRYTAGTPVLPRGGRFCRSRYPRYHPSAPVHQSGDGQVRQARGVR